MSDDANDYDIYNHPKSPQFKKAQERLSFKSKLN
jgi:hypothetical protein